MAIIAPWIQAPDVAGQYSRGLGLGAQIAQESERLKAENARTTMEAQARNEANMRQSELERARIATEQAYRTIQTNIAQERLNVAAKAIDARTKQAALIARDQALFNQDIATGMPIPTAMARHPLARAQQAIQQSQGEAREKRIQANEDITHSQKQREIEDAEKAQASLAAWRANRPQGSVETTSESFDPTGQSMTKTTTRKPILPGGAATQFQQAPVNPKERKAGTTYLTPKGPHTWTGTGWQKPETEDQAAAAGTPPDAQ